MRMIGIAAVLLMTNSLSAQSVEGGRAGERAVLERSLEMDLARSAAPPTVSEEATVLLWNGRGFDVGHEGSNGVTCYVARSWPDSLEPHCFDEEGARTILPIHLRQMELWHQGKSGDQIEAAITEGLRTGEFRLPIRPAMSYMMSAAQQLISDEGQPAGAWRPHLMIYFPYLTEEGIGVSGAPSTEAAMIVDPGTPRGFEKQKSPEQNRVYMVSGRLGGNGGAGVLGG